MNSIKFVAGEDCVNIQHDDLLKLVIYKNKVASTINRADSFG